MRRIAVTGLMIGLGTCLVGCNDPDTQTLQQRRQEDERITQALPAGCTIHDFGPYRGLRNLVVVTCDGRSTTTSTALWSSGTAEGASVSVGDKPDAAGASAPGADGQAGAPQTPFGEPKKVKTFQVRPDGSLVP